MSRETILPSSEHADAQPVEKSIAPRGSRSPGSLPGAVLRSCRPKQWTKNGFLFAALLFAQEYGDSAQILRVVAAFFAFSALAGAVYLVNDILDLEKDRLHPRKCRRPIASGQLKPREAAVAAFLLASGALVAAFVLAQAFALVAAIYLGTNLAYSLGLKNRVIFDVFIIALGFVLRVIAGALVIHVPISPWLLICTMQLALFLALCKRRHELLLMDEEASSTRKVLSQYSPELLDQMISVVTASSLMSYSLYTVNPDVQLRQHTTNLHLTIPFVLFGILRYLYLVYKKNLGGSPELVLLKDLPMIIDILLWVVAVLLVLTFG